LAHAPAGPQPDVRRVALGLLVAGLSVVGGERDGLVVDVLGLVDADALGDRAAHALIDDKGLGHLSSPEVREIE
jgi:hypothetical protein